MLLLIHGVDDGVTANVDAVEVLNSFVASVLTDKVSQSSVLVERKRPISSG